MDKISNIKLIELLKNELINVEITIDNERYKLERIEENGENEVHGRALKDEIVITAPMTGIVHFREDEHSARIKKGEIVCVMEAMKMYQEIIAEFDMEIMDFYFQEGQLIEYGKALFRGKLIR